MPPLQPLQPLPWAAHQWAAHQVLKGVLFTIGGLLTYAAIDAITRG